METIDSPEALKKLLISELNELATKLRKEIIEKVSESGGHLASNLGVVELTIALHYVFNTPKDKIIWDVGHQCYAHKLLTGRRDRFHSLRKMGGLSGFPKPEESPYDAFGTGHSSTSISAATGFIEARDLRGESFKTIAVIGDGALTSGLAFEGLNHAGHLGKDLIVILNDNEMSISKNVGALSLYLNRILSGEFYRKFKKNTQALIESIPKFGVSFSRFAQKLEDSLKAFFLPGVIFEELGFTYIGPIDGHNIPLLIETLKKVSKADSPHIVHIITKKGLGYEFSEKDPTHYHGVGPFELKTGSSLPQGRSYSDVFGEAVLDIAKDNLSVVAISAAMTDATGLKQFAERFPKRFYDVGISESHAVTFAAGLAMGGLRPVVAIYSTFLQRAYDQIVHDVCLQNLPVVFAIDRAGIVGEDGPTHHGVFDISYLRHIPNIVLMAPKDSSELRQMLSLALRLKSPSAIRYPRGRAIEIAPSEDFGLAEGEILISGSDIAIIALGSTVEPALSATNRLRENGIDAMLINARFIKPLDEKLILYACSKCRAVLTVEEGVSAGGFGNAVLECLNRAGRDTSMVKILGLPDSFIEHGTQRELREKYMIDPQGIYKSALELLNKTPLKGKILY